MAFCLSNKCFSRSPTLMGVWLISCLFAFVIVDGDIGPDGLCALHTFVPFTVNGSSSALPLDPEQNASNNNPGFSHLASALMAIEHFNNRDNSVVLELSNLTKDCNVKFDTTNSRFYDTGSIGHMASREFFHKLVRTSNNNNANNSSTTASMVPCAIAGPFSDQPALELSAFATAAEIPLVAHGGHSLNLVDPTVYPYTSLVIPDMIDSAGAIFYYLLHQKRWNYIFLLYSLTDINILRREVLSVWLDEGQMKWDSEAYIFPSHPQGEGLSESRGINVAMRRLKNSGYRTIVVAMHDPTIELPLIAAEAEALELNNGDYFWLWFGGVDPRHLRSDDANVTKVLSGSVWVKAAERHWLTHDPESDPYHKAWISQDIAAVDRLNAANPISDGEHGYLKAEPNFFQRKKVDPKGSKARAKSGNNHPEYGCGFLYDVIMSIGIGACLAERSSNSVAGTKNTSAMKISGSEHLHGIRNVFFHGATGNVAFQSLFGRQRLGSRMDATFSWIALNLLPPTTVTGNNNKFKAKKGYDVTDIHYGAADIAEIIDYYNHSQSREELFFWKSVAPFYFADGRTVPPDLLIDESEQNYLSSGLRRLGLSLMGIAMFSSLAGMAWVLLKRKHRVLVAAQPHFLYEILFGSIVSASTILTISFDESYGFTQSQLSSACMASCWLLSLGHIITYGALFSKLWRVNRVLQFARRKIEIKHVAWPSSILIFLALAVLTVWTALGYMHWDRVVINDVTGESIGMCESEHFGAFLGPLVAFMIIPSVLTAFMAYRTKDVDDAYSESWWIFVLIFVQLEVVIIAVPVVILLRDVSTNGRYLGFTFMMWTFPMSTLLLIILPKVLAVYKPKQGHHPKRGESGGVRISGTGISASQTQASSREHQKQQDYLHHQSQQKQPCSTDVKESLKMASESSLKAIPKAGDSDERSSTFTA